MLTGIGWTVSIPAQDGYYWGASRKSGRLALFRISTGAIRSGVRKGQRTTIARFDDKHGFVLYDSSKSRWLFWPVPIKPPSAMLPVWTSAS